MHVRCNNPNRRRRILASLLSVLFTAGMLTACSGTQNSPLPETAEELPVMVEKPAFPQYRVESAEVSSGKEAVQVQQATEDGFLVLINRMVRDEIPEELLEDPDFVNDGRYAVYENALFFISRSGKRTQISGYTPLPAPENPEELEDYLCEDGIHPSRKGQELIFQTIRQHMKSPAFC